MFYAETAKNLHISQEMFERFIEERLEINSFTCIFNFDQERKKSLSGILAAWFTNHTYKTMCIFRILQWATRRILDIDREELVAKFGEKFWQHGEVDDLGKSKRLKQNLFKLVAIWCKKWLLKNANFTVSEYVRIPPGFFQGSLMSVGATAHSWLGNRVSLGENVQLVPHGDGAPRIEDDVIVWTGAVIVGRVTVGKGAVVGANSLVISDVPSGTSVLGVPAKQIFTKR